MKKLALAAILILGFSALGGQFGGQGRGGGFGQGPTGNCLVAGGRNGRDGTEDTAEPRKIDRTQFVYARLRYHPVERWRRPTGIPGLGGTGEVPWHHDYPDGDSLFPDSLQRLTSTASNPDSYQIVDVDSPELFKYPFIYMSEPGYLDLLPADTKNLREYFQRGGFMLVDDFRGNGNNNYEYENMAAQFKKLFPDRSLAPLPANHPIFHVVYDIDALSMLPPYRMGNSGEPQFLGLSDDKGRLQIIVDFNNDLSEYWQGLDVGKCSVQNAATAVKLGVNYAVYAMTH